MQQELIRKILTVIFPWKVKQSNFFICVTTLLPPPPGLGKYKLVSKPGVLFYSDSNLLPACGVQSVQRTEGNSTANSTKSITSSSTTKSCLKSSTE